MANAYLKNRQLSYEQEPVSIYFNFTDNGSGTISAIKGGGISTIVTTGTGLYTVTLREAFSKVLGWRLTCVGTTPGTIVASYPNYATVAAMTTDIKAKTFKFVTLSATGTAAYIPAATVGVCHLVVRNSSVGPWD
jgi:hypothetical protein